MPEIVEIREALECRARPREVWKLLYDPVRFATWWPGWERVEAGAGDVVTHYDERSPDFPYTATVAADSDGGRVVISCLLADLVHVWSIEPNGDGCLVSVLLTIPTEAVARAEKSWGRANVRQALATLVARAEESCPPAA
jgi:uncharacterized protein YndB with AHSA1/START domain